MLAKNPAVKTMIKAIVGNKAAAIANRPLNDVTEVNNAIDAKHVKIEAE